VGHPEQLRVAFFFFKASKAHLVAHAASRNFLFIQQQRNQSLKLINDTGLVEDYRYMARVARATWEDTP